MLRAFQLECGIWRNIAFYRLRRRCGDANTTSQLILDAHTTHAGAVARFLRNDIIGYMIRRLRMEYTQPCSISAIDVVLLRPHSIPFKLTVICRHLEG
ncbi:hypothetical protein D3C78_905690 [compost metagenome]